MAARDFLQPDQALKSCFLKKWAGGQRRHTRKCKHSLSLRLLWPDHIDRAEEKAVSRSPSLQPEGATGGREEEELSLFRQRHSSLLHFGACRFALAGIGRTDGRGGCEPNKTLFLLLLLIRKSAKKRDENMQTRRRSTRKANQTVQYRRMKRRERERKRKTKVSQSPDRRRTSASC